MVENQNLSKMKSEKATDLEVIQALEQTGGRVSQAADLLGIEKTTLYTRVRKSQALSEAKANIRATLFADMQVFAESAIKTGYVQRRALDADGKPTGQIIYKPISDAVRLDGAFKLMAMFKEDDGIVNTLVLEGSVDINKWLSLNSN